MSDQLEPIIEEFKIQIDNYITTLDVLKLFGHEMCCDPGTIEPKEGAICWCGRKMTTSEDKEITPDLVIKLENNAGIIADEKSSFPKEQEFWDKTFNHQLAQYDDTLKGWNNNGNEQITHDLILLVPEDLRVIIGDYLNKKIDDGEIHFDRNFAAVSYRRQDKAKTFYYFCKFYGDISDPEKNEELRKIARVPSDIILPIYNYSFCDQPPPLPYTMSIVWDQIGEYLDHDALIENFDTDIVFNPDQVICDLKAANSPIIVNMSYDDCINEDDPRNPSYPKAKWVRKAIKALHKMEYIGVNEDNGDYSIPYRKYKRVKTPLETFQKKLAQSTIKSKTKDQQKIKQLSLFQ